MVTLKEIAARCGVSIASVSKALNGAPDIGAETGDKIRRTAREMGYYPNAAARALKTNRSHNIGVLFEDQTHCGLTHEYFVEVLNAVKNQAEQTGYDVTFICQNIGGTQMSFLEHCRYRRCDGVVIASVDFTDPTVTQLVTSEIPVVTIDYVFDGVGAVLSDNVGGMAELTEYVIGLGHRRIACIHGEDTAVTRARLDSFHTVCAKHGLVLPEAYVIPARFHDTEASRRATLELMAMETPPTCILYPDDISLLGGVRAIKELGADHPVDVSIAGYDGISMSRLLNPALTTLCQDSEALGREAAKMLVEAIENPKSFVPRQVVVPGTLQPGSTVRAWAGA